MVDQSPTQLTVKISVLALATAITTSTKSKENSYTKPEIDKCYRCGEPRHRSNECPKRKEVVANYGDEDEVVIIEDASDSDFLEEHGDPVACVVQKLLCNQKIPGITQRHQIFYSKCSVKDEVCNLIVDNVSCENIVSRTLVVHWKLETITSPSLHHWVDQERPCIKVKDLCHVPISIGEFYQDSVACDVVDMDKCHILLGRHDNMMLTRHTKIKRTFIYLLGKARELL